MKTDYGMKLFGKCNREYLEGEGTLSSKYLHKMSPQWNV